MPHRWNPAIPPAGDLRHRKQQRGLLQPVLPADRPRRRRTGDHALLHDAPTRPDGEPLGDPVLPGSGHRSRARTVSGAQEEANPSCPAASEIGHTIVSAGVGTVLAQTPGKIYLAGPYHGAPLSIVSITSAKVGPFDLGTVVIRFALDINPITAQVEVRARQLGSDPAHHRRDRRPRPRNPRLHGPRKVHPQPHQLRPMIDHRDDRRRRRGPREPRRPGPGHRRPRHSRPRTAQASQFKPRFTVSTQRQNEQSGRREPDREADRPRRAGDPGEHRKVKVELPKQLPSRLTTLQKACTAALFKRTPRAARAASIIGHAKAITPILPVPLEGPAYFVSHGGEAFPSLIVVLQGYGITIDLVGIDVHQQTGHHQQHVQDRPRPARHELRTDAPRGALLRARGHRQPLLPHEDHDRQEEGHGQGQGPQADRDPQGQGDAARDARNADRVRRPERRGKTREHPGQRDGLCKSKPAKKAAKSHKASQGRTNQGAKMNPIERRGIRAFLPAGKSLAGNEIGSLGRGGVA